jgi:2C-methyl-D-erythritol 2,4-cyclodiphosphate synthase
MILTRIHTKTMAKDVFHQQVKNALIKEGWNITHDPLTIRISEAVKLDSQQEEIRQWIK